MAGGFLSVKLHHLPTYACTEYGVTRCETKAWHGWLHYYSWHGLDSSQPGILDGPKTVLRSLSIPASTGGTASLARCMAIPASSGWLPSRAEQQISSRRPTRHGWPLAVAVAGLPCSLLASAEHVDIPWMFIRASESFSCENATGGRRQLLTSLAFALAARRKKGGRPAWRNRFRPSR